MEVTQVFRPCALEPWRSVRSSVRGVAEIECTVLGVQNVSALMVSGRSGGENMGSASCSFLCAHGASESDARF
eukprot:14258751-Alexandrium_andersonii.AAC.1